MAKGGKGKSGGGDSGGDTGGTTTLRGGKGFDSVTLSGSVWDYRFVEGDRGEWLLIDVNPDDGDDGTLILKNWEEVVLDDRTVDLIFDGAPVYGVVPEGLVVTYGDTIDLQIEAWDADDWVGIDVRYYPETTIGSLRRTDSQVYDYGDTGQRRIVSYTYDTTYMTEWEAGVALAEGETTEQTWIISLGGNGGGYTEELTITVVGVNDAPMLANEWRRAEAVVGITPGVVGLAELGSDPDSDDDGSTLTYVLTQAPVDWGVAVEGTDIVLRGGAAQAALDSDEFMESEVWVKAVDRHGAESGEIDVDLRIFGGGEKEAAYLTAAGDVDYAAIGLTPGAGPVYGILNGFTDDPALLDLVTVAPGANLFQVNAARMANFFYDPDAYGWQGVTNYDSLPIDLWQGDDYLTGGDDRVLISLADAELTTLEAVEIVTGWGDDVVVVDMTTAGVAYANGVDISTGQGSDQVFVRMDGGTENLWRGSIFTGTGHDVVDIRITDSDPGNYHGYQSFGGSVSLGTGDDVLNIEVSGQNVSASFFQPLTKIDAGAGNDVLRISNADTTLNGDNPFFSGGFDGEILLGNGDDLLILNLSRATTREVELTIASDFAVVDPTAEHIYGSPGHDVLVLEHLTAADDFEFKVSEYGRVTLVDGMQTMYIGAFEEIILGDGSSLYDLM
ncbi:hypothetical protein [Sagittula sp. S175]|uniref:hypothetical protein n=1 Tax=Sagittula sp. S175 TaxID=3415129 RepID=UPI003C7D47DA